MNEIVSGHPFQAMRRLLPIWKANPGALQIVLNFINASCASGRLSSEAGNRLEKSLTTARIGTLLVSQWLEKSLCVAVEGRCPGISMQVVERWLDAAQKHLAINTTIAKEKNIPPLLAQVALQKGKPKLAPSFFNQALAANISPETAAGQASLLASYGHYQYALAHLDYYHTMEKPGTSKKLGMPYVHNLVLDHQEYWPRELLILREKLIAEVAANPLTSTPDT